jgi:tRNA (guanine37-N1)-methyltransferase
MRTSKKTFQYFIVVLDKDVQHVLELLRSENVLAMGISRDPEVKILNIGPSHMKSIPLQVLNPQTVEEKIRQLQNSWNITLKLEQRQWNDEWQIQRRTADLHENLKSRIEQEVLEFIPKTFDTIGNIAILEIDRWGELSQKLPKKEMEKNLAIVGNTILSLHKNIHTVLRKIGNINGEFRIRNYELLAGDQNTTTIHKENNCSLVVDPTKMFFSPRLSYERNRVASYEFTNGSIVLDCFAGCGPFSIQIASKHNIQIYSVEKNPEAYSNLKDSIELNRKTLIGTISSYLGDFRKFIKSKHGKTCKHNVDYIIMNLPERSLEFIPYIIPYIKKEGTLLFFYMFIQSDDPIKNALSKLTEELDKNKIHVLDVVHIRKVFSYSPTQNNIGIDIKIR